MKRALNYLEFNIIKNNIEKYTYSKKAHFLVSNLLPSKNINEINNNLDLTNYVSNIVSKYGKIPFLDNFDNVVIINEKYLPRVYYLEEFIYIRLYLEMESNINTYFSENNIEDFLKTQFYINDHRFILSSLNKTFSNDGTILDDATKELKTIRTKIKHLEFNLMNKLNSLLSKYKQYLTEEVLVIRNNRYCLSVKEKSKHSVPGVIHDVSNTGATVFIEPQISLTVNNEIEILRIEENKEIEKILIKETNLINNNYDTLHNNLINLINLDFIHAKSIYSNDIDGIKPNINNIGILKLVNAKHPLIKKEEVVPISLTLDNNNKTLLITGPNTGGKTVSLKTTGLLTLMMQSGILIPVSNESNLNVFDNIFVDIGDEQSIENSLSTFSSHIAKIISYLDDLTNNSLVLLDELGSGTDPLEGVALAISIIEEFEKKDIKLIVTSHFSELKTYALEKEHTITASVAFDKDSLKPLYYLKHGITGESHARLIAKRLGINESVINRANELFESKESDLSKLMKKLEIEKEEILVERMKLETLEKHFENEITKLKEQEQQLIKDQNMALEKIREEQELLYQEKMMEIDILIENIENNKNYQLNQLAELKGLKSQGVEKLEVIDKTEKVNVGDLVFIKSYGQYGTVYKIERDNYHVKFGIFDLSFKLKDLRLEKEKEVKKPKTKKKVRQTETKHDFDKSSSLSVDLRGFRYEEVAEKLDKAIDKALLSNVRSMTIIHGFGTFAVKNAVMEYIRKSNLIKSHRGGKEGEGLGGVTIVTLK